VNLPSLGKKANAPTLARPVGPQADATRLRRRRVRVSGRFTVWLVAVLVAAAVGVGVDRAFFAGESRPSRPALQQVLDRLVQSGTTPGVTAYVAGPNGTWLGAAGVADVNTGAAMRPGERMRIESLSKTWLTAVILEFVQEGKLNLSDTVARWLPGLLRAHGSQITIQELMTDTSGLIDDNDVFSASPAQLQNYLTGVSDARLRTQLEAAAAQLKANPRAPVSAMLLIGLAAWQPLVATPGTTYHHSNIGWNVAGLIAAKAGGEPLPTLYRERLFQPLALHDTAFSPQGPIAGSHAEGYARNGSGPLVDTTTLHPGKFADGAIVTNAQDEATFLRAAMNGTLFDKALWLDLYGNPGNQVGCANPAYNGEGSGDGYHSYVWYDTTGKHIAVLLLNQNDANAARALYCHA
jgi:D-alanyl-D-alanine carboxypeptidase